MSARILPTLDWKKSAESVAVWVTDEDCLVVLSKTFSLDHIAFESFALSAVVFDQSSM